MAKGTLNKVILIGRLGADPEMRSMPSGVAVANLRLATNEGYKDKQTGQFTETTEWHRVVLFGRAAEVAKQYLAKGRLVYIEGRIRTNKWQDKDGQDRYTTEIVASDMQLLGGSGGREEGGMGGGHDEFDQASPFESQALPKAAAPRPAAAKPAAAPKMENFDQNFDDDIPF